MDKSARTGPRCGSFCVPIPVSAGPSVFFDIPPRNQSLSLARSGWERRKPPHDGVTEPAAAPIGPAVIRGSTLVRDATVAGWHRWPLRHDEHHGGAVHGVEAPPPLLTGEKRQADNRRDFTGGWIGDPQNAFTSAGRTSEQQQIFSTAQALLHLRSTHAALQSGLLWHLFSDDLAYVFLRETEEERIVVAFNNSNQPRDIRINFQDTPAKGAVSFPTLYGDAQASLEQNQVRITMPPQSLSIFQLN